MCHHLELVAGGNTNPVGANAVARVRETACSRLLPARRQYAMLPCEIIVRLATYASSAGANWQSRSVLALRCQFNCDMGFARCCDLSTSFCFSNLIFDEGQSALCAELRPAHLIFPAPRPWCANRRRAVFPFFLYPWIYCVRKKVKAVVNL